MVGLAIGGLAIGTPIAYLAVRGIIDEAALAQSDSFTCARITERQMLRGNTRIERQVHYEFVVDGEAITHADETGRTNLWANLGRQDWEESLHRGCVDVVYVEGNPWVNRPVRSRVLNDPRGNAFAAIVLSALTFLLAIAGIGAIWRRAHTTIWKIEACDDAGCTLVSPLESRYIALADVKKAIWRYLPPGRANPPWRFDTDVLELRTPRERFTVELLREPKAESILARLRKAGRLKRKRAA